MPDPSRTNGNLTRREFLAGAGAAGLVAATAPVLWADPVNAATPDGTPEQVHLQWAVDPSTRAANSVVVSWASLAAARNPRVVWGLGTTPTSTVPAVQRIYTDGLNGETVFTYHAALPALSPSETYTYQVSADNSSAATPFSGTFRMPPAARSAFRFTSFGDLATPNTAWSKSYGQSAFAVAAVESFAPAFHLMNGDLAYANNNTSSQPEVWRDYFNNLANSAANRPWMPCPGNHEVEFDNGPQGGLGYLTRFTLPDNGSPSFSGRWYSFRVGAVMFVSLDANDVIYQDDGSMVTGPAALIPAASTGNPPIPAGASLYITGYSNGAQTAWLQSTLAAARADKTIDWIVCQMHQCALSSSSEGNGCDRGIREQWLPLFDQYQVDLVVNGHDHDYERSFPVRGHTPGQGRNAATGAPVETLRPTPVTLTDTGVFDTSQGTVYLVIGGGGTSSDDDAFGGADPKNGLEVAQVFTVPNRPVLTSTPGVWMRNNADTEEDAVWSAKRDTSTSYGVAVFDIDPGTAAGGQTTMRVSYFHAAGADITNPSSGTKGSPNPNYTLFEQFDLVRPRSS